jgi:hypothetical protein
MEKESATQQSALLYEAPQLIVYGSVAELTASGTGQNNEGGPNQEITRRI